REAGGEDANARFIGCAVLELGVAVHRVDMRIALQNGRVIGSHQRRDMRLRIARAQRCEQRRGADQVADVVAPDDEDSHALRQRAPPPSSTPVTPQKRSEFCRTNSMSVMLRVSMPASTAMSAMPHAALTAFASAAKRRPWRS